VKEGGTGWCKGGVQARAAQRILRWGGGLMRWKVGFNKVNTIKFQKGGGCMLLW